MKNNKCPKGTRRSKSGKPCSPKPKPKRYKLNWNLIYGKRR